MFEFDATCKKLRMVVDNNNEGEYTNKKFRSQTVYTSQMKNGQFRSGGKSMNESDISSYMN